MTDPTPIHKHRENALLFLEETFESRHHGIYIDRGTSLFETLDPVTAEEASLRATERTASIAAHVRHVVFYVTVIERLLRGEEVGTLDWREIWENDRPVGAAEWDALRAELRREYDSVRSLYYDESTWKREEAADEFVTIALHTAYHLGAIRQALAVIRSRPAGGGSPGLR